MIGPAISPSAAAIKNCDIAEVLVSGELREDKAVIIKVNAPAPKPDNVLERISIGGDHANKYIAQPDPLSKKQIVAATRMFLLVGALPLIIKADTPLPSEKAPIVHPKYDCNVASSYSSPQY